MQGSQDYGSIIKISDGSPEITDMMSFLRENLIFAGYILPNIINYGFNTDFFECFYAKNNSGSISFAATRYYNSAQVFCKENNPIVVSDFANLVKEKGIKRISGNSQFVKQLKIFLNDGVYEEGTVVVLDNNRKTDVQSLKPLEAKTMEEFKKNRRIVDGR